jgi:hypothetical protein
MDLVVHRAYYLEGMETEMWDAPHPVYGAPKCLAARYLGSLTGLRRWHAFEVWVDGEEKGCLFMNDDDLAKLRVVAV